ncbi:MAG: glycosyltransferase [Bacteroidales bacterium]|nr:glycosyltransferase [Bacteroidales bacterium]
MPIRLSYILPIYNVEQYLAQCLDSIFSQDLPEDEYEVICVNDGSTDGSRKILEQYQSMHINMQILTFEQNRGLSAARNEGIRIARGKYIWLVDSDDFIGTNVTSQLLQRAEADELDVLLFNYCDFTDEQGIVNEPHTFADLSTQTGIDFVNEVFGDAFVYHLGYVWRFLIRKEYLIRIGLSFPEGQYWEDTVYFPKAILGAKRVASADILGYYYRKNPTSISGGKGQTWSIKKILDYTIKVGIEMWRYSEEIKPISPRWAKRLRVFAIKRFKSFPIKLWQRIKK